MRPRGGFFTSCGLRTSKNLLMPATTCVIAIVVLVASLPTYTEAAVSTFLMKRCNLFIFIELKVFTCVIALV